MATKEECDAVRDLAIEALRLAKIITLELRQPEPNRDQLAADAAEAESLLKAWSTAWTPEVQELFELNNPGKRYGTSLTATHAAIANCIGAVLAVQFGVDAGRGLLDRQNGPFYEVKADIRAEWVAAVAALNAANTPNTTKLSADTQKFSEAVDSVACPLTQELLWARWNGIHNGTNAAQIGAEFRKKNSKKLGKTAPERKAKWATISRNARRLIKPFVPDE